MKVISIWNPYASLLAYGCKSIETRSWPAPKSLIGQRIGIASTKQMRPEQRAVLQDEKFMEYFSRTGLPQTLEEMPNGFLLGTIVLHSSSVIEEEDIADLTEEERLYGYFKPGFYAWRCRYPEPFFNPLPVRGAQGVWEISEHELRRAEIHALNTSRGMESSSSI